MLQLNFYQLTINKYMKNKTYSVQFNRLKNGEKFNQNGILTNGIYLKNTVL